LVRLKKNIGEKKQMDAREFIKKTAAGYDTSNAFITSRTSAGYINPAVWNREVLKHVESNLVVSKLGKTYTDLLNKPGTTLYVTVGSEPTSAAAIVESDQVAVSSYAVTQVTFTPSEYGAAYQLTNKEKSRSFINLMQDMTQALGYKLARDKDDTVVALLQASAGNSINSNSVVTTDITTSDTLNYDDIVNAKKEIMKDKLFPKQLVVGAEGYADLLKLAAFRDASQFGGEVARTGFIGRVAGLDVYWTTQIVASTTAQSLVLGTDGAGVPCFGICQKVNPYLETEYNALGRYTTIVAVEEYDVKMLRANGCCTITSYAS